MDVVDGTTVITKLEQMDHTKIALELENANKLMADMIGSLDTDFLSPSRCEDLESSLDKKGLIRGRAGSLSTSQPDITIAEDSTPPPLPPRDVMTPTHRPPLRDLLRTNSEHSLMTQSLCLSRSEPSSPFHSTKPGRSVSISDQSQSPGKRGKALTLDRSSPNSKKKQKKSGSMSDYYRKGSNVNVTASLNVASLQNGNEPSSKSPKRSKWNGIKNKMKKFKRSPSLEAEEMQGLQGRYARKGSLISDSLMSTGINLPDGGMPRRQRRSSSSYGNSVALVSKIFAVLSCWQEQFFEVGLECSLYVAMKHSVLPKQCTKVLHR